MYDLSQKKSFLSDLPRIIFHIFLSSSALHRGQGFQGDSGVKMKILIILIFFYGVIKYDGM